MDFFPRRCFFREMPLLPGHKITFSAEKEIAKEKQDRLIR
jgi:hypothetical protein